MYIVCQKKIIEAEITLYDYHLGEMTYEKETLYNTTYYADNNICIF